MFSVFCPHTSVHHSAERLESGGRAPQILASSHVDADAVLRLIPPGQLLEVRALLLERFGRHQEILR